MRTLLVPIALVLVSGITYGQQPAETDKSPPHETDAKTYHDLVEKNLKLTYPATATRMLRECGNIRDGICLDIGCGTGRLDVELAKRSNLKIVGLDINLEMKEFFDKNVREAGLEDRIRFVAGDAQELPFPDDYADVIVSRGTIIFIPDLAKCLVEVERVLKPTGVAFLGGRYLYAPAEDKMSRQELRQIVQDSGVRGAQVIDWRGQWVKILGPNAPVAARESNLGPSMLAHRCLVDFRIAQGACLLICSSDNETVQEMQRGFLELTELKLTALYPNDEVAGQARAHIRAARQEGRITCHAGKIEALPFSDLSFDLAVGAGPMLIFSDRQQSMRELYRVLRPGGAALIGGRFLHMPAHRKVTSEKLRTDAQQTGIPSIRILDDRGQWVEIRKEERQ